MPTSRHENHSATAKWKTKRFMVSFQAGPGSDRGSYSYYRIEHTASERNERRLIMQSAHSIEGFGCVTNGMPKNWIRVVEDAGCDALVIEEEIPNDCGPCSNYLWVRLDSNGLLDGNYLQLPSKTTGDHGGINYEYPRVTRLDGEVLEYSYTDGETVSQRIVEIEKADDPTFPG